MMWLHATFATAVSLRYSHSLRAKSNSAREHAGELANSIERNDR